jgi:hypothetical protein
MAGVVLLVMEELWVLVVALAVAAAVFYAVMDWLNGGSWWD